MVEFPTRLVWMKSRGGHLPIAPPLSTLGNLRNHVLRGDGNVSDRVDLERIQHCSSQNMEIKQSKMFSWNVYGVSEYMFRSHRVTVLMHDRVSFFFFEFIGQLIFEV